jgi:hypothetical protein
LVAAGVEDQQKRVLLESRQQCSEFSPRKCMGGVRASKGTVCGAELVLAIYVKTVGGKVEESLAPGGGCDVLLPLGEVVEEGSSVGIGDERDMGRGIAMVLAEFHVERRHITGCTREGAESLPKATDTHE